MRSLFLLLLLANIGFFAYHYLNPKNQATDSVTRVKASPGGDGVTLLAEAKQEPVNTSVRKDELPNSVKSAEAKEIVEQAPPSKLIETCFEISGFISEADAKAALDQLLSKGFIGSVATVNEAVLSSYWVKTGKFRSRNEALKVFRAMQAASVESFLIESGEDENTISVGLFKNKNNALEHISHLKQIGFNVTLKEQFRDVSRSRLNLSYRGLTTAPAPLTMIANPDSNLTVQENKCPERSISR